MGKKSREKRERRALKLRAVSTQDVTLDGNKYRMQEWHMDGSEPISTEQFKKSEIVAQVGHKMIEPLIQKLADKLPRKRVMIIVPETYVVGEHPITISVYPPFTERQRETYKSIVSELGERIP